jgi:hypothetical protein
MSVNDTDRSCIHCKTTPCICATKYANPRYGRAHVQDENDAHAKPCYFCMSAPCDCTKEWDCNRFRCDQCDHVSYNCKCVPIPQQYPITSESCWYCEDNPCTCAEVWGNEHFLCVDCKHPANEDGDCECIAA